MGKERQVICVSKSLSNWRKKLLRRLDANEYGFGDLWKPVIFFGVYRPDDIVRLLLHRGKRTVIWCGSDCLSVGRTGFELIRKVTARHICENEIEQNVLRVMLQQEVEVQPLFFSNPYEFKISFKRSRHPRIFMHVNKAAERESGLFILERIAPYVKDVQFFIYGKVEKRRSSPNVIYRGYVEEKQFNREIQECQGAWRAHEFDGFAETLGKSVLCGQFPISRIRYPMIDSYRDEKELVQLLKNLKNKKRPNYGVRNYYFNLFTHPIWMKQF